MATNIRLEEGGASLDLDACAREPIRTPGQIQPQGTLLVLSGDDLTIVQAAVGSGAGLEGGAILGRPLDEVLPPPLRPIADRLKGAAPPDGPRYLGSFRPAAGPAYHAVAHTSEGQLVLELEEVEAGEPGAFDEIYPAVSALLAALQDARSVEALGSLAAREVRRITRFDRVLVYRFDEQWNGTVIAEDRNDVLPSYLDLRFPASDIPAQARDLYRLNRLRLIADANYVPVPIEPPLNPATGRLTDLQFAILRSVSPVHLEYMRNMGTGASMSISLLREGELWGLISCHNREPRRVPYHVRTACDLIGQVLSLQFAAREQAGLADRRIALRAVQARLLAEMAAADGFIDGLAAAPADLLALTDASGVAIVSDEGCRLFGETPDEAGVLRIAQWLADRCSDEGVATDHLAGLMPAAESLKDRASGILAMPISRVHASFVIWFRPEVIRTVSWGGAPKAKLEEDGRIHPRQSFEVWKEAVRLRSRPWQAAEVEAAAELRSAIVDIVLRSAEELAQISEQLLRSNKELEAFSYSMSHDLRAPFRHIVGYAELLKQYEGGVLSERGQRYIETIIESAVSAGTLVDDLLSFSQMGRATLNPLQIDMNGLVQECRRQFAMETRDRQIEWRIDALPPAFADPSMLRLVIQNLLENAIKFTRDRTPAVIEMGGRDEGDETVYFVEDNGVGFDMAYVGKLFGVFQRLHRVEEFAGTGIGLANVKRIIEQRHGGRVWAEGKVGQGARISFSLPKATAR